MRRSRPFVVIAHRGASAAAPENTSAAICAAVMMRADMIELDVQVTRDHRLVIFHDKRLERTTNGRGVLARQPYRTLARLDCGSWFAPRFADERLLLMTRALRLVPAPRGINLELKPTTRHESLVRQLIRSVRQMRLEARVLVSSSDPFLLAHVTQHAPAIRLALVCHQAAHRALRTAIRIGCVALHPHTSLVTGSLVRAAHAARLRVHAWTVDHLPDAARLRQLGLDGVFTNVPDRLVRWRQTP